METPGAPIDLSAISIDLDLHVPYGTAVERVRVALRDQGFGVLTEIDVQATFKEKLDADFRPYVILGACNPVLAHEALSADLAIGLLLPCNVVVYETEPGRSRVQIMDPVAALAFEQSEQVTAIAHEARGRLEKAADTLRQADELAREAV